MCPAPLPAPGIAGHLVKVKRSRGLPPNRSNDKDIAHSSCGLGRLLLLGLSGSAQQGKIHLAASPGSLSNRHLVTEN